MTGIWGVLMSGAGEVSSSAGSRRSSWGCRRAAGSPGESEVPGILGRGLLHRMVAAGIVITVALCLSWMPVRGLTLGAARPDRHAAGAAARLLARLGEDGTRCHGVAVLASPGVHGAFVPPGDSCRGYRPLLSPGRQPGPGGHDIRLLAFRHRAAEEPAWSRRGGCTTGRAARMPRLAAVVIDRAQLGANAQVPAGPVPGATPDRDRLHGMFPGHPALTCLAVGAGGLRPGAGAGIEGRWCGAFSGGQVGCADRASLPGRSPRYHLIWLVCGQCRTEMALLFYDQGDLPLCASCPDGQMELRQ